MALSFIILDLIGQEITRALVDPDFSEFEVKRIDPYYVCFTEYDKTIPNVYVAFKLKN